VRWTAPAGGRITGFVITVYAGWSPLPIATRAFDATRTVRAVTGLRNGRTYRFKVSARYADGAGPASVLTKAVRIGRHTR